MRRTFFILPILVISLLLLGVFVGPLLFAAETGEPTGYRISYGGTCINDDGKEQRWLFSAKAIPVPTDATCLDGYCYTPDGTIIGLDNGDGYVLIQSIFHDACAGFNGLTFKGDASLGSGSYK